MRDERPPQVAIKTYRYLRLGMVAVLAALAVSVVVEMVSSSGCVQRSISAYYYTPARSVFVGALIALGLAMITLLGNTPVEDAFLNLAGLFAPVVAFVPTSDANYCSVVTSQGTQLDQMQSTSRAEAAADTVVSSAQVAIDNNVTSLLVVVAVTLLVVPLVSARSSGGWERPHRLGYVLAVLFWLLAAGTFVWSTDGFYARAHFTSAVLLFACIIIVVISNAYDRTVQPVPGETTETWLRRLPGRVWNALVHDRYGWLGALMVVSAVAIWAAGLAGWDHWVLAVEADLIVLFGVFWMLQTVELWPEGWRVRPATRS